MSEKSSTENRMIEKNCDRVQMKAAEKLKCENETDIETKITEMNVEEDVETEIPVLNIEEDGDALDFNPYANGNEKNHTSFWGVVMHLFIIAASPTIMNIPATFEDVGYLVGFFGSLLIVSFYAYCMHTIISIDYLLCQKLRKSTLSYAKIIFHSFATGPKCLRPLANIIKTIAYINFLGIWAGGNAVYVLMIGDNIKSIYDSIYATDINVREVILYTTLPLIVLCWIPNLRLLVICSTLANIINIACLIIISYASIVSLPSIENRVAVGNLYAVPLFLGTCLITINSTGMIIPLKNQMKDPKKFASMFGALNISYVPVGLLYSFFGLICYMKYGHDTKENVVLNMQENHTFFEHFFIGMYSLGIIFFYPVVSYVSYDIIWNENLQNRFAKTDTFAYSVANYTCKTITAMSSILMAYLVPNVGLFVSLFGTVGTSLDSIIFPAIAETLVRSVNESSARKKFSLILKNAALIGFGVVMCCAGLWDSLSVFLD